MPKSLVPRLVGTVVVLRIPRGTEPKKAYEARRWARNIARKINKSHERDHWYEKGDWK